MRTKETFSILVLIVLSSCINSSRIIHSDQQSIKVNNRIVEINCPRKNNTYIFNGKSNFINLDTVSLSKINGFTLSINVRTDSDKYQWIIGKYDWKQDAGFHLALVDGIPRFNGRDHGGKYIRCIGSSNLMDFKWHQLIVIYNGQTWQLWVDGKMESETTSNNVTPNIKNSSPLEIGRYKQGDNGYHAYFEGEIKNINAFNKPLTSKQIHRLFTK